MNSSAPTKAQISVKSFKQQLKDLLHSFVDNAQILHELAHLRSVRRPKWDADLDYYGNRKHPAVYREMKAAKEAGLKAPRWNSSPGSTSSYPLDVRIRLEREAGKHKMHRQLRSSISRVMSYLVDRCDLVSGVCVAAKRKSYREIYVKEIANSTGLGKRTVQRALSNLTKHRYLNRGVALITITPAFYKAIGLYSTARALASSLRGLMQLKGYRGSMVVDPEAISLHKNFHRFNAKSAVRPSLRKLLASSAIGEVQIKPKAASPRKVPQWNTGAQTGGSNLKTGPPPEQSRPDPAPAPHRSLSGVEQLKLMKQIITK